MTCLCDQHGDYCIEHPNCACGCPKHAHSDVGCVAGSMNCHGCRAYRPAQIRRFRELNDDEVQGVTLDELRRSYIELRSHHIEESTANQHKLMLLARAVVDEIAK